MQESEGYAALVLRGESIPPTTIDAPAPFIELIWRQLLTAAAAIALAAVSLFPQILGGRSSKVLGDLAEKMLWPIRAIHTGRIGDYVAWFVFGTAAYGIFLIWQYR